MAASALGKLPNTDEESVVKKLAETKTIQELEAIKSKLTGSLIIAPPGEYYGQLTFGLMRVNRAIEQKQKQISQ